MNTNSEKLESEFLEIFSRHSAPLFYYVVKLTKNEETAKDIVQECFVRLWENMEKIDRTAPILPLLITYIKNLMRDEYRKNKNYQHLLADLSESTKETFAPPDAEKTLALQDRQQQLDYSLSQLSEKRKNIFRLIRIEGLSYKEVAETLDLSISDIKKQMRLSLQHLRKVMNTWIIFF